MHLRIGGVLVTIKQFPANVSRQDLQSLYRLGNALLHDLRDHLKVAGEVRASLGGGQVHKDIDLTGKAGIPTIMVHTDRLLDPGHTHPGELEPIGQVPVLNIALGNSHHRLLQRGDIFIF